MSRETVRIAYDGDAFLEHRIDVRELAPSMLALADMFSETNRLFNGDEAKISVFVRENFEERCFDFGLELIQQWAAVKSLLRHDDTLAARELLELVLLGGSAAGAGGAVVYKSVTALFRAIRGRKPKNIVRIELDGQMAFQYEFEHGQPVVADNRVHLLYQNKKIRGAFERVLRPILQKGGVNKFIAYLRKGGERQEIASDEATTFDFKTDDDVGQKLLGTPQVVQAWLQVYSPVYDPTADKWRFW